MENKILLEDENSISEARRYVENAKQTLKEHGNLDSKANLYKDRKYVKCAGNYLWLAVLIALDGVFQVKKTKKKDTRVDIDDYKVAVAHRDRKLLDWVNYAYDVMHLSMNYDGIQGKAVCDEGFRLANDIIDRCAALCPSH